MAFDWLAFLTSNSIEFTITKGNREATVNCPFCKARGDSDPSQHLSINLQGKGWHCWRSDEHRGKNPTKLVQALLNCSWQQAASISGSSLSIEPGWNAQIHKLLDRAEIDEDDAKPHITKLPIEFRPFNDRNYVTNPYFDYMRNRGFRCVDLTLKHRVYFATQGAWKGRVIFAVYHDKRLVGWTGRAIFPAAQPRYLTLTDDPVDAKKLGVTPAVGPIHDYLLWFDQLMQSKAHTLYVGEGPMDALRVQTLGERHGICATCLFTSSIGDKQIGLLHKLLPRFKHKYILLDNENRTLPTSLRMTSELSSLGLLMKRLPAGVDDPAKLDERQLLQLGG